MCAPPDQKSLTPPGLPARSVIRVLPETLANRIAAGEVVERPASVVKELIENSLDAGARQVDVHVVGGGTRLMRVADDGCGMNEADAILAFDRHATSKIKSADDIERVATLGFRGEALPAIASVARVVLETCQPGASVGTRVVVEGGKARGTVPVARTPGTTVTARDLFFNTPARRHFLRSASREFREVHRVIRDQALGHPETTFTLKREGRETERYPAAEDFMGRLRTVVGQHVMDACVSVTAQADGIAIEGIVGPARAVKAPREHHVFLMNGRPVEHRGLFGALHAAWNAVLREEEQLIYLLGLRLDPERLNVNVHPTKREVRFAREAAVLDAFRETMTQALRTTTHPAQTPVLRDPAKPATWRRPERPRSALSSGQPRLATREPGVESVAPVEEMPLLLALESPRVLGQVAAKYIVLETGRGLWVVDQHVAHERILYEKALGQFGAERPPVQGLLTPLVVQVNPTEREVLLEAKPLLEQVGFELRELGIDSIGVVAVPGDLWDATPDEILRRVADQLTRPQAHARATDYQDQLAAAYSCSAAIKAGFRLSHEEMTALVKRLLEARNPRVCPHGRPTLLEFSEAWLDARFDRT